MDVHVPLPITRGLRRRGVDVVTAQDDGGTRLTDTELLDRALALGRILFSQDEDLLIETVRRQRVGEPFATVVYAHQMQVSIGRCILDLEVVAKAAEPTDLRNQIVFL